MANLVVESWTWYGLAVLIIISRLISRSLLLGSWKRLQIDDMIMVFALCTYTVLVASINIVAVTDTNLMLPETIPTLTPASIKNRIFGSKMVLILEQCMILTIWCIKVCLLLLYNQLTMGLKAHLAVKFVAGYVALGFVVIEIFYFGVWCRPFSQYWAVPVANDQCSTALHHLIMQAVFNISSDIMMLCIPLPLLLQSQLPPKRKAILCGIFGMGAFVILSAALNKYYSFTQPFSPIWTFWYIREASTAIIVSNLPMCWHLLRRGLHLTSFTGSSSNTRNGRSQHSRHFYGEGTLPGGAGTGGSHLGSRGDSSMIGIGRSDSEERITGKGGEVPLEIWQDVQFVVETKSEDASSLSGAVRKAGGGLGRGEGRGVGFQGEVDGSYKATVTSQV